MPNQKPLRETKQHGAAWFPFNIYPCTIPQDFPQVALHWQDSMELVFVKKGRGIVQAGLTTYTAEAGDVYVFAPGVLHALRQLPGEVMEYENIIFDLELLGGAGDLCAEKYLLPLQSGRLALPMRLAPNDWGYTWAVNCLHAAEEFNKLKDVGYELCIKGELLLFLAALVGRSGDLPPADTPDTRRLKTVVQLVNELGVKAVGISGKDGMLLRCEKKLSKGEDIGFVGEITKVDPQIIYDLLEKDFLPIICPIGSDEHYASYNINADDAACAIARAVNAEKLAFLTDVEGVYRDFEDKSSLISEMTVKEAQDFVNSGSLGGGMLPKLQNCIDAIENGVSRVHILDGRIAHCLLLEIFTNRGIGTAIYKDGDARYFHEEEK